MHPTIRPILLFALFAPLVSLGQGEKDQADEEFFLPVTGRITDGENKLEGCRIVTYDGNDVIAEFATDKSGKFEVRLGLNKQYGLEFHKDGFVPKRIVIDTRADVPAEHLMYVPLIMDISMLEEDKYEGVDTDVLDFPFAIVKYSKVVDAFVQDQEYTMGMQRTNGSLLLMAARAEKRKN